MKILSSQLSALVAVAVCGLSGCASVPQSDVERRPPEVKVYDLGQLPANRYEVVSRIWVDSWRTAFWPPTYPSQDEAITSLKDEAARVGADGLVNVICLDQGRSRWFMSPEPAVLCYGNAIRVRRSEG
jgi:hypothetical protein